MLFFVNSTKFIKHYYVKHHFLEDLTLTIEVLNVSNV